MTSQLMPTATTEQAQAFNELQRKSSSPECAVRYFETVGNFDVRDLLQQIAVPTLVLHVRGDVMVPIEEGRQLAANIPGAKFVSLPGKNHLPLENDPGMPQFFEEISAFLSHDQRPKERTACPIALLWAMSFGELGGGRSKAERQRSDVQIVSGAPEKHVPRVPGLWRVDFLGWKAREMVHSSTGFPCIGLGTADKPGASRPRRGSKTTR